MISTGSWVDNSTGVTCVSLKCRLKLRHTILQEYLCSTHFDNTPNFQENVIEKDKKICFHAKWTCVWCVKIL